MKILGSLWNHPMGLTDLAKEVGLKRHSVYHHTSKLRTEGFLFYDAKSRLYYLELDDDLAKAVLLGISTPKSIAELSKDREFAESILEFIKRNKEKLASSQENRRRKKNKGQDPENSPYSARSDSGRPFNLIGRLSTALEILKSTGYCSFDKTNGTWSVTWLGCNYLGICIHCKGKFEGELTPAISLGIQLALGEFDPRGIEGHTFAYSPIVHTKCLKALLEFHGFKDGVDTALMLQDYCHYCGMPLSEGVVRGLLGGSEMVPIYPRELFTRAEIKLLIESHTYDENYFEGKRPSHSSLEDLFRVIEREAKQKNIKFDIEKRINEVLQDWRYFFDIGMVRQKEREDKVSSIISSMFGVAANIYPDLTFPTEDEKIIKHRGLDFTQKDLGMSLVCTIQGNRYHIPCYLMVQGHGQSSFKAD